MSTMWKGCGEEAISNEFPGIPQNKWLCWNKELCPRFPDDNVRQHGGQYYKLEPTRTIAVEHPHGCGHLGEDKEHIVRAMSGFCSNPNVAGVLLVGNGCEQISPELIAEQLSKNGQRFEILSIQEEGGTTGAVEKGKTLAGKLLREAEKSKREPISVSELIIGTKCGGSDTLSGSRQILPWELHPICL